MTEIRLLATRIAVLVCFLSSGIAEASKEEDFRKIMDDATSFLESPIQDLPLLDRILSAGEVGGFFSAYEYFDFIKSLGALYPNYITKSIPCGKSYQSREIKAYRLGDLS
jgi:hypothetical protein